MPSSPERIRCFKNLWDYDLCYTGDDFQGVIDELESPRDKCLGFVAYDAGYSPAQHLEHEIERRRDKLQWRIAKLSF